MLPHSPWQLWEIPSLTHGAHGYSNLLSIRLSHSIRNYLREGKKNFAFLCHALLGSKRHLKRREWQAGERLLKHEEMQSAHHRRHQSDGPRMGIRLSCVSMAARKGCVALNVSLNWSAQSLRWIFDRMWFGGRGDGLRAATTRNLL